jgi:3-oxoacid CoA-transferase A subunit
MSKVVDIVDAVKQVKDGDTVLVGGFGPKGYPGRLLRTLLTQTSTKDLMLIQNAANPAFMSSLEKLMKSRARGGIVTFLRGSTAAEKMYFAKTLDLVPQGTFAERLRAGGKGIAAFYTPVGPGTEVAEGKETAVFDGVEHILEKGIFGDVALVRATQVDLDGNCFMRGAVKNFTSLMPLAAKFTIVEAEELVPVGTIPQDLISVPGKYVNMVVRG